MSESDMWRWADEQGEQRLVAADELRAAIASGVLPPSTLVWREGMSVWVPAISVEEFADALPNVTNLGTVVQPIPVAPNAPASGPSRSTLQGLAARETFAAVVNKAEEKEPPKEKRTPSVAPPRPAVAGGKTPLVKTLRPNSGPLIPPAARLPSDGAAKSPLAPRPIGAIRPPAPTPAAGKTPASVPPPAPAPAPPPRGPSTTGIDKNWAITDDETTNVPGKTPEVQPRPEPPPENASHETPSPRVAPQPQAGSAKASVIRTTPPPSPSADRRPVDESTESATFQLSKNALSLRGAKPPPIEDSETSDLPGVPGAEGARNPAPPDLIEAYAKPVEAYARSNDEAPPTAPSANLGPADDEVPAYANKTTRLEGFTEPPKLPEPPKMREPTATTMLPIEFQQESAPSEPESASASASASEDKPAHEVSRTIRLAADFLNKLALVRPPQADELLQMKPPPVPPPSSAFPSASPALRQGQAPMPAQLPMNALLMSGGLLITMVVGAFFVGRCSVKPTANYVSIARVGLGNAVHFMQVNLPAAPKPCWLVKQPARWAAVASKNVPFEMLTLASGKIAIGYAKSDDEAVGIEVLSTTGQVTEAYADKATSEIARVTPTGKSFFISTAEPSGSLKSLIPVSAEKPFYLGIADKHLAWADQPNGAANRVWPIDEEDTSGGIRVLSLGNQGFLTAFRAGSSRQRKVFAGLLGPDRKPVGNLVNVAGSGGSAGEPMVGSNGREVAVVFGDQAGEQGSWKLRIGRAPMGKIPSTTTVFEAPAGGPGGNADYPAIAGLADGRWVLIWTEGPPFTKIVRAQTFGVNFTPLGDPIVLSPPSGNYGSSMVGVIGNYVTVVFVAKGRANNELWGSVLQCG